MVRKLILFLLLAIPTIGYSQIQMQFSSDSLFGVFSPLDDDSLVFQNVAGLDAYVSAGVLASDGDKVYKWINQGPLNHEFYRPVAATNIPNYRDSQINGYPALEFRYGQYLRDTIQGASQGMIFVVMKLNHDSSTVRKFYHPSSAPNRPTLQVLSTEVESFFSSAATVSGSGSINGKWVLLTYRMPNSTTIQIREDGADTGSGAKDSSQNFNWDVRVGFPLNYGRMYVAEFIQTAGMNTALLAKYEEYLRNKYNLY